MWIFILSDYKSLEQIEFAGLFEKLKARGITAIEVAHELQTTPQAVSMWNKLRAMVARICDEPALGEDRLKDSPPESDLATWRRRAKAAEGELAQIKSTLRKLCSNSKLDEIAENNLAAVAEEIVAARPPKVKA